MSTAVRLPCSVLYASLRTPSAAWRRQSRTRSSFAKAALDHRLGHLSVDVRSRPVMSKNYTHSNPCRFHTKKNSTVPGGGVPSGMKAHLCLLVRGLVQSLRKSKSSWSAANLVQNIGDVVGRQAALLTARAAWRRQSRATAAPSTVRSCRSSPQTWPSVGGCTWQTSEWSKRPRWAPAEILGARRVG